MSVRAAFYVADGNIGDKLIRFRTNSDTSHVELIVNNRMYSSSPRDGGVRSTNVPLNKDNWRFIDLPHVNGDNVLEFFGDTRGMGYDWVGVTVGQFLYFNIDEKKKWFCSEWCSAALGFTDPWRFTPGLLEVVLKNTAGTLK